MQRWPGGSRRQRCGIEGSSQDISSAGRVYGLFTAGAVQRAPLEKMKNARAGSASRPRAGTPRGISRKPGGAKRSPTGHRTVSDLGATGEQRGRRPRGRPPRRRRYSARTRPASAIRASAPSGGPRDEAPGRPNRAAGRGRPGESRDRSTNCPPGHESRAWPWSSRACSAATATRNNATPSRAYLATLRWPHVAAGRGNWPGQQHGGLTGRPASAGRRRSAECRHNAEAAMWLCRLSSTWRPPRKGISSRASKIGGKSMVPSPNIRCSWTPRAMSSRWTFAILGPHARTWSATAPSSMQWTCPRSTVRSNRG